MAFGLSLLNPGRRNPSLYRYAPMSFEEHLREDGEYHLLRYTRDRAQRKLARLQATHAPEYRVRAAEADLQVAQTKQLEYLVAHAPPPDPPEPTALHRELSAEGDLTVETESAVTEEP